MAEYQGNPHTHMALFQADSGWWNDMICLDSYKLWRYEYALVNWHTWLKNPSFVDVIAKVGISSYAPC